MSHRSLDASLTRVVVPIIFISFMTSLLLGSLYVFFQLPRTIFTIPLYAPVQVKLGLATLISTLIPFSLIVMLSVKSPAAIN